MFLVIDQTFWHLAHCDLFYHLTGTTTSFGHVASPWWFWMPSHCDTMHEFELQREMHLGFEFNKMNLFICIAQNNYSTQMNIHLIQYLYEFDPIQFMCVQPYQKKIDKNENTKAMPTFLIYCLTPFLIN